jgi:hypothetical protein
MFQHKMKTLSKSPAWVRLFAVPLCLTAATAFAQLAPPASQSQTTLATPIPLSGRTGQSGSVAATEAPIPGANTSVNTINPTVQVQGPYAGSVDSTNAIPFSGKLSLR